MAEYCENCGAELRDDSKFCQECGSEVSSDMPEEDNFCPNCGQSLEDRENFCENCGTYLNAPQTVENEDFIEKYKLPIMVAILAIITILAVVTIPMIMDYSAGSQIVNVDGYDFKIPANFNESPSDLIVKDEYGGTAKHWKNGDEYIEIWILPGKYDAKYELAGVGGAKQNQFGYTGYHNIFEDGGEVFSFVRDNNEVHIFVTNPNLFNKIEVL